MPGPDFDWTGLPEELRYGLLLGGVGRTHLADLARWALGRPETAVLGLDLLLAAFEAGPLDGGLAGMLAGLDARAGFLSPGARAMAQAAAAAWREPEDAGNMADLAGTREYDRLLGLLREGFRKDPVNLFWSRHLLDLGYLLADWDAARRLVQEAPWPGALKAARDKCLGDVAFQLGDFEAAGSHYKAARLLRPARFRLGQCLFRQGRLDEASREWRKALAQAPWNTNILLRLHDRLLDLDRPSATPRPPLPGGLAVCLYTSGKARELEATLGALYASDLDGARVVVLDNGSTDGTQQVLAAWRDRIGGALETIRLPVNVGAPAARNWLARHEAVAASRFTAFLDDDALVPPDWVGFFGRAVEAYPQAGVWGCKVVDLAAPGRIQNADVNFLDDSGPDPVLASLCSQDLDFGQFDYIRPCLSVTGCCHLFRTSLLEETGDFDIRFSPTQYDDLDHDLGQAALGRTAVYQGGLTVRHARLSGALLNRDRAATGVSLGNLRKLSAKYPPEARRTMRQGVARAMLEDVLAKQGRVRGLVGGAG
jgi:hypothetical protein